MGADDVCAICVFDHDVLPGLVDVRRDKHCYDLLFRYGFLLICGGVAALHPFLGFPSVPEPVPDVPQLDAVDEKRLVDLDLAVLGVGEVPCAVGLIEFERIVKEDAPQSKSSYDD